MIKFDKPVNFNGTELLAALKAAKIKITELPTIDGNGDLWLEIKSDDEVATKTILDAHNGTTVAPNLSAQRKTILDRLGITADEAAILLG